MRWLAFLLLLSPSMSYGVDINNTEAISASIGDPDSFRFFYIGHAYGAHNKEGRGESKFTYPHPEIIRLIDELKVYNFGAFGGDVVEICNKQSVKAFEDFLVKPLGLPLINSMGNHDNCMDKIYHFPPLQSFTKGNNTFLIINSKYKSLDKQKIEWITEQLRTFNRNSTAKRIFIFTHRPSFLLLDPSLREASNLANYPVKPDEYFTNTIGKAISEIDTNKEIFWFAGDIGIRLSLVYKKLGSNTHLVASGLYERDNDHYLDITVDQKTVDIKVINFLTGKATEISEYSNPETTKRYFLLGQALNDGWSETILASLYQSIGLGKGVTIKPKRIEGDTEKVFDIAYHAVRNSLFLSKEKCTSSGDNTFYVQFYPVRPEDRKHHTWLWNGYHFYASRIGKNGEKCVAIVPLPDYPVKFILTGQHYSTERKSLWLAEIPPPGEISAQ